MPFLGNPAQRLDWVVQQLMGSPSHSAAGQVLTVRAALTTVYGDQGSNAEFERMVATVVAMPDQALAAQKASPQSDPYFMRWYGPVNQAVGTLCNLDGPIADFQRVLQPQHLESLGVAARLLGAVDTEADADEFDLISRLTQHLDDLLEEVVDSGLHADMVRFLVEQIERMRCALQEYRLRGVEGITQETDAAVGAILRSWAAFPADERSEAAKGMFHRVLAAGTALGKSVVGASQVVTAAVALEAATPAILQLFS